MDKKKEIEIQNKVQSLMELLEEAGIDGRVVWGSPLTGQHEQSEETVSFWEHSWC